MLLVVWGALAGLVYRKTGELRSQASRTLHSATNVVLFCYSVLLWGGSAVDALTILR